MLPGAKQGQIRLSNFVSVLMSGTPTRHFIQFNGMRFDCVARGAALTLTLTRTHTYITDMSTVGASTDSLGLPVCNPPSQRDPGVTPDRSNHTDVWLDLSGQPRPGVTPTGVSHACVCTC